MSGLAILYIEKDKIEHINMEIIISEFATKNASRKFLYEYFNIK
jgi:hypothetical protein